MMENTIVEKNSKITVFKAKTIKKTSIGNFECWPNSLKWGTIAGVLMGLYLLILQIAGADNSIGLKFFKYIFLFGILGFGLSQYKKTNPSNSFFSNGIKLGAQITFVSAIVLGIVNLVVTIIAPEMSFNKFSLVVNSISSFLVTSGAIFFEILVFGMVGSFIFLQYLKGKNA